MHHIWPGEHARVVDEPELERLYSYPAEPTWLAVNFVSSADGAVAIRGRSAGLSNPADRVVFQLGSDLADVVLRGAGTVKKFHGVHPDEQTAERRRRHGLAPVPPTAVVTTGLSLPPTAPVITEAVTPTIVITCGAAPQDLRKAWEAAGARVFVAGDQTVDLAAAVAMLTEDGLGRIDCEGGPRLFASLLSAGLVDELRLTLSPLLVSGDASRITAGLPVDPAELELASVLADGSTLLLRYLTTQLQQVDGELR
jgi:riboflavin biosynthesis pyrimidine reductase